MSSSPMNVVSVGSMEVASNTDTVEQISATLGIEKAAKPAESEEPDAALPETEANETDTKPSEERERNEDGTFRAKPKEEEAKPEEKPAEVKKDRRGDPRHDPSAAVRLAKQEAKEARERTIQLEAELASERAAKAVKPPTPAAPATQTAKAAPDDDPEPDSSDEAKYPQGQFDPAYNKDLSRWATRQEHKTLRTQELESERAEGLKRYVEERKSAVEKAIKAAGGPEFQNTLSEEVRELEPSYWVLARGEQPTALNALADEVLRAGDHAPRLMRYLTEHPDVIQRLSVPTLRPSDFAREMGRIEATLDAAATAGNPRRVEVSQAKPPVRPVAGSPHTTAEEITDDMPFTQYLRVQNRKEGKASRW